MHGEYAVYMGNERVGSAAVTREGLYYRISCRCRLSGTVPCRIAVTGEKEVDMGLCVPQGDEFGIEKRIPIKKIGEGELRFQVLPRHQVSKGIFVAISPEEPFRYIARLKDAYLARRNGQIGLTITNLSPDQPDSGQNP